MFLLQEQLSEQGGKLNNKQVLAHSKDSSEAPLLFNIFTALMFCISYYITTGTT